MKRPLRRRAAPPSPLVETSLKLRRSLLEGAQEAVEAGHAPSLDHLVHQALSRELRRLRQESLEAAYDAASRDPVFLAEMKALADEFDCTTADGLD